MSKPSTTTRWTSSSTGWMGARTSREPRTTVPRQVLLRAGCGRCSAQSLPCWLPGCSPFLGRACGKQGFGLQLCNYRCDPGHVNPWTVVKRNWISQLSLWVEGWVVVGQACGSFVQCGFLLLRNTICFLYFIIFMQSVFVCVCVYAHVVCACVGMRQQCRVLFLRSSPQGFSLGPGTH